MAKRVELKFSTLMLSQVYINKMVQSLPILLNSEIFFHCDKLNLMKFHLIEYMIFFVSRHDEILTSNLVSMYCSWLSNEKFTTFFYYTTL